MTRMPIRTLGDPVLRQACRPVETFDEALRKLADDLFETMYDAPGVGLAANQVGLSLACFVYDDREGNAGFVANPELSAREKEQRAEEGCLSIPGPFHEATRALSVSLRGKDGDGGLVDLRVEGYLARIFQHETDHLNCLLYIDHLNEDERRDVMRQLREHELKAAQEDSEPRPTSPA